jgi:hypothetical protein
MNGWTKEKLAEKEGKSPQWIAQRLRFGRFLNFSTMVEKTETLPKNLTERKFRKYWERTAAIWALSVFCANWHKSRFTTLRVSTGTATKPAGRRRRSMPAA